MNCGPPPKKTLNIFCCAAALSALSPTSSRGSSEEAPASPPKTKDPLASSSVTLPGSAKTKPLLEYSVYMTSLMDTQAACPATASPVLRSPQSSPEAAKKVAGDFPSDRFLLLPLAPSLMCYDGIIISKKMYRDTSATLSIYSVLLSHLATSHL